MILAIVMVFVPSVLFVLVENSGIQTRIANKFLQEFSQKIGSKIEVKKVKINLLQNLILEDILVLDQQDDTLLFVPKLRVNMDSVSLRKKYLIFDHISLFDPDIRISQSKDSSFNFSFILDSLAKKDTLKKSQWYISPGNIRFYNGSVSAQSPYMPLNFSHNLGISDLNTNIALHKVSNDSLHIDLKKLSFLTNTGLHLKQLKTEAFYSKNGIWIDQFLLLTDESKIHFKDAFIENNDLFKSRETLANAEISILFDDSKMAFSDFTFLYQPFERSSAVISLVGNVDGRVNNMRFSDFLLEVPKTLHLNFSGEIVDVSHPSEMFIFVDFSELFIQTQKTSELTYELGIGKPELFQKLTKLGNVTYKGELTGLPGNYVMFGTLNSSLGKIKTDLSVETDYEKFFSYNGRLETTNFQLSPFVNKNSLLGSITMLADAHGLIENGRFQGMDLNGYIKQIDINGYPYSNIDLNGYMSSNLFNGALAIKDPNLDMNFFGRINFDDEAPQMQFDAEVKEANLGQLALKSKFPDSKLHLNFTANVLGKNPDNFDGFFTIKDVSYENYKGAFNIDSFRVDFTPNSLQPTIDVHSDIMDGQIRGNYHFASLYHSIKNVLLDYLTELKPENPFAKDTTYNNFTFETTIKPIDTIAYVLDIPYFIYEGLYLEGELNDYTNRAIVRAEMPLADMNGFYVQDFELYFRNIGEDHLQMNATAASVSSESKMNMDNFSINGAVFKDSADLHVVWNNNAMITNSGNISTALSLKRDPKNKLISTLYFNPSSIILADSQWVMPSSAIQFHNKRIDIQNFRMEHKEHYFAVNGVISDKPEDSIQFNINNFELAYLYGLLHPRGINFGGKLNGQANIHGFLKNPLIQASLKISDGIFNDVMVGDFDILSEWKDQEKMLLIDVKNQLDNQEPLVASGSYTPENDSIELDMHLNDLNAAILRPFLQTILKDASGYGSGNLKLKGELSKPYFDGTVYLKDASVGIEYLNTTYYFNDDITMHKNSIVFDDLKVQDKFGNQATLNGEVTHNQFQNMAVDLSIEGRNINVLNTTLKDNDLFYGTVFGSGFVTVKGANSNVTLDANLTTMPNSFFYLPITETQYASDNDFITYIQNEVEEETKVYRKVKENINTNAGVFTVNLDVNATPDAKVELIFDETVGEKISGQGSGLLSFNYVSNGDFTMNGEYRLSKGDYLFTMLTMINKSFQLKSGSTIRWNGSPFDATINLDAYYKTRAPLYDLMPTAPNAEELKKRFPVQCHMMLTNSLLSPDIKFNIILPTAEDETQRSVESIINTEDEMSRQVISLLAFNRFYTPEYMRSGLQENGSSSQTQAAAVTASEFLSSQLSNWLSQISNDVNFGVSYRPGDNVYTNTEVEAIFNTQLWDDRIEFNGTVGYRDTKNTTIGSENATNFIGDFEVFFKLNEQFRFKAYSRTNDNIYYETAPTTQGIGLIYKEEFNDLEDLQQSLKDRKRMRKEKRQARRDEKNEVETPEDIEGIDNPYSTNDSIP